jgi:hypothetical protein
MDAERHSTSARLRPYLCSSHKRWQDAWRLWRERGGAAMPEPEAIRVLESCAKEAGAVR